MHGNVVISSQAEGENHKNGDNNDDMTMMIMMTIATCSCITMTWDKTVHAWQLKLF